MDGDGWLRQRTEYRYVEESIGEDWDYNEVTTTSYHLWSSVLGMRVSELDDDGELKTGFVYAGRRIARLDMTPSSSTVEFEFVNPVTGTSIEANHTGLTTGFKEYDPLGAQVPTWIRTTVHTVFIAI